MVEISVKGVAGIFLGLSLAAYLFITTGNGAQNTGRSLGVPQLTNFGSSLTGYGDIVLAVLIGLAVLVVMVFVLRMMNGGEEV
jgi:hypothetical protein